MSRCDGVTIGVSRQRWQAMDPGIGRAWDVIRLRGSQGINGYVQEMQSRNGARHSWAEVTLVTCIFVAILLVGALTRFLL